MRACQTAERSKGQMLGFEKGIKMENQKEEKITKEKSKEEREHYRTPAQPANNKTYLAVPFSQKDAAKKLGAKWDVKKKSWYAPEGADMPA